MGVHALLAGPDPQLGPRLPAAGFFAAGAEEAAVCSGWYGENAPTLGVRTRALRGAVHHVR
jgi:hypothetical protein